jgi:hypothetical protein
VQPQRSDSDGGQCFTTSREANLCINAPMKNAGASDPAAVFADIVVRCAALARSNVTRYQRLAATPEVPRRTAKAN